MGNATHGSLHFAGDLKDETSTGRTGVAHVAANGQDRNGQGEKMPLMMMAEQASQKFFPFVTISIPTVIQ